MEHVDPITGATEEWEAFIASLDPERLEQERFGHPSPSERPGSAEWRRMVADHDAYRFAYYRIPPVIRDYELELMLSEIRAWDRRFENNLTPEHVRIALRAHFNTNPKEKVA
ncbi:hypothetical protein IT072_02530 [Leifsonia sp. ZF2019]|uniref:hypothetical protein n=1 Tax=Leifsonia sp. ZF2019 TaxID=2781978 RepID=UPI001CBE0C59|nr:hypothetical protein [Leifsonia sp. ZF2019]UAJ79974.1 hypothetical protein IT072_02530 [Leifsonia sp. ZF2019]